MPVTSGWERAGVYNDRPNRRPGLSVTIVRHKGASNLTLKPFPHDWQLFMVTGDLEIAGEKMKALDQCVIAAGEEISGHTSTGCEYLVIGHG